MLIKLTNTLNSIVRRVLGVIKDGLKMWLPFENSEILGEDLNEGYDFTSGWTEIDITEKTANTFKSDPDGGLYKTLVEVGKSYKLTIAGTTDASSGIRVGNANDSVEYYSTSSSGVFSDTITFTSTQTNIYVKNKSAGEATITTFKIQEVTQIAPDKSGNSNGATLYTGKALSFDGVNDYVDLGVQSNPATNMTFACWLNPVVSASTSYQTIIDYGKFNVWLEDNDTLVVYTNTSGAGVNYTISDLNNKWYRIVVSVSGTTTSVYIDGTLIAAKTTTALSDSASQSDIGRDGTTRFFEGKLSDVQVYDVAWTQSDVTFDYDNPQHLVTDRAASTIALSNLKGYWHLSEGAGAINYDSSGEGNNGAISGATWSPRQATIPQLGLMDWSKPTIGSDVVTLISDPNDQSKDILGNLVRLREHSLNLDGSGYAKVDSDSSLDITNYSIDGWIYNTNNTVNWETILVKHTQDNFQILVKDSNLTYYSQVSSGGSGTKTLASVSLNAWTYFCITESSGTLKCYINDDSTPKFDESVNPRFATSGHIYIGSKELGDYSNALIDDIRVYNGVLSADEVLQNHKAGLNQHKTGSSFSDDFSSDYGF